MAGKDDGTRRVRASTPPWALVRFAGRVLRRFLLTVGVVVVLVTAAAIYGYVEFESIVAVLDAKYSREIDARLGIDRSAIARLHDPTYFAEESVLVTEDRKAVACLSSPEHRILIHDTADIPPYFTKAILASEDRNFFTHEGIDKAAILRALVKRVLQESRSGASTLTMQIAKHLRGGTGRPSTEKEKVGDIVTALRIERNFSRQDLLVKYVNMPYFGRGQYGIEAASRGYFGKPAKDLALHQAAFIVALINKPALPDRTFAKGALTRTRGEIQDANWGEVAKGTARVLGLMLDEGVISAAEYQRATNLVEHSLRKEIVAPGILGCGTHDHFLERVRILYKDRFPLNTGGLTISITRDDGLQDALAQAVDLTLDTYLARHPDDADNHLLRAGAFAVDFTGSVLAEVGNVSFKQQKYDVIATGWRQPGSTFKIFTYGALVERLVNEVLAGPSSPETIEAISAETLHRCNVLDAPIYVSLGHGRGMKKIENFHSRTEPQYRGEISCQIALGESRNTAAMRAGAIARIKNVIELTYRLGMPRDAKHLLQPYPTTAIGASEVNPLWMASTVAFVNGGFRVTPRFANDVCRDGKSLLYRDNEDLPKECDVKGERQPPLERIMHPAVSAAMTELLKAPADIGTGTASALRNGVIPGMDPLGEATWKLKPDERKKRMLAFPAAQAGEIAAKTGTATNADGRTSDVWLLLFVPGPPDHPDKGVMLGFWMGKDAKGHPLGARGSTGGAGFAESGGRNWVHSAATVLAFLQKERGLLKPGHRFQPLDGGEALANLDAGKVISAQ